jgi:hypothetical protein
MSQRVFVNKYKLTIDDEYSNNVCDYKLQLIVCGKSHFYVPLSSLTDNS